MDSLLDRGMCYGYCILSACLLLSMLAIVHRSLHLLCAPATIHHFINATSLLLFFYREELTSSTGKRNIVLALTSPWSALLGVSVLGVLAVIHWNFTVGQAKIDHSNLRQSGKTFRKDLLRGVDRMDGLHRMLNTFRTALLVGILCFYSASNASTLA